MGWVQIVGLIIQVLQAAGVFDWLAQWFKGLLERWASRESLPAASDGFASFGVQLDELLEGARPGWDRPVQRMTFGVLAGITRKNAHLIFRATQGRKLDLGFVEPVDVSDLKFLNHAETHMNADFVSMVQDLDDSHPDGATMAGANGAMAFFDGSILALIRLMKAGGVQDYLKWIQVAVMLITTLGPKVKEIWAIIQDAINQNKSPKDVLSDLVVAG